MPTSKSAKKRHRQSLERRIKNRNIKSALKTFIRRVRAAVAAGQAEEAQAELRSTSKKLDQAAAKNVIHAGTSARLKSRLAAAVKGMKKSG